MTLRILSCLALLGAAQTLAAPAFSLTPQDVWGQWQGVFRDSGYSVDADVASQQDGGLQIRRLELRQQDHGAPQQFAVTTGGITLTPEAQGAVQITLAPSLSLDLSVTGPAGETRLTGSYSDEQFQMQATGTPEQIDYAYSARALSLTISDIQFPDAGVSLTDPATLITTGLQGKLTLRSADRTALQHSMTADSLRYSLNLRTQEAQQIRLTGLFSGLSGQSDRSTPRNLSPDASLPDRLRAGDQAAGNMRFSSSDAQMVLERPDQSLRLQATSAGGSLTTTLGDSGLHLDTQADDLALTIQTSALPLTVQTTLKHYAVGLDLPLMPSKMDQPFALRLSLQDLALPDIVWALVDGQNQLPHDPLSLDAALSGTGRLKADPTAPGGFPAQISALSIDRFDLRAAGASLTASGDLAFDADEKSRFGPYPKISGQVEIAAKGVMGLIQTLASIGILPASYAFSASLYGGMFMRQINGPDDLASTIEVTPSESVTVNGQVVMP